MMPTPPTTSAIPPTAASSTVNSRPWRRIPAMSCSAVFALTEIPSALARRYASIACAPASVSTPGRTRAITSPTASWSVNSTAARTGM